MRTSQARTARQSAAGTARTARQSGPPGPNQTATAAQPRRDGHDPIVVLGRYRLKRRLGTGAFGTVWLASDERLEREVAVKLLARERVSGGRFEREARAAARLSHPGIVTLYEASVDDEGAYLVSELVRGRTLDDLLEAGLLSDRDIISIGIALCDALEHAHGEGVVHRDVKPSNVLVPDRPVTPAQVAKLTDFGVARVVGGDTLTRTGDVIGTLAYMAPEQAEGLLVGPPADLYSLALVLYEALTGINPVRRASPGASARRLGTHLPPLRRQRRDLPRELGQGLDLALRPRPRERGRILDLRRALVAAHGLVGDEPGVVEAPPSVRETLRRETLSPQGPHPDQRYRDDHDPDDEDEAPSRRAPEPWPARAVAALAVAALTAWLSAHLLAPAPVPPALAALVAAAATLVLPRVGWLVVLGGTFGIALAQGHGGFALVAALALFVPALLMPFSPTSWSLATAAPALGLVGLAGAWPALAARSGSVWRRAALGATGWVWLLLAAPLAGRVLYLPLITSTVPASAWAGSPSDAITSVVGPTIRSGALAPAVIWALGAAILPWLVRGRSPAIDLVRVVIWSAVLVSATSVTIAAAHGGSGIGAAPTAIVGAVIGGVLALAESWLKGVRLAWRPQRRSAGSQGQFP